MITYLIEVNDIILQQKSIPNFRTIDTNYEMNMDYIFDEINNNLIMKASADEKVSFTLKNEFPSYINFSVGTFNVYGLNSPKTKFDVVKIQKNVN